MHAGYHISVLVLIASWGVPLVKSLDLFSENLGDPSSELDWTSLETDPNDDNVDLFDDNSEVPLVDTIFLSGCDARQQSLVDDGLSLFGRDDLACLSPSQPLSQPRLPLSPETLQLFQDPGSLQEILQNSPLTAPPDPGRLSLEEVEKGGDVDSEGWRIYWRISHPWHPFEGLGLWFAVCCDGPSENSKEIPPGSLIEHELVWNCDPLGRMYWTRF